MLNFLKIHNLLRLFQEEIENPDRPIMNKDIESVIKDLPTQKAPVADSFTGELFQTFKMS